MSVTHRYHGASPGLVCFRLLDKEVKALLDPGDIASGGVESGVESASGSPGVLANPQEPEKTEREGCFQHQLVMTAQWVTVQ